MSGSAEFMASRSAQEARYIRRVIRKADLTKSERDIVIVIVNLWFYHRSKERAEIHPGRKQIAKRAGVSVRTVASLLARLRAEGVLTTTGYPNGGTGCSTRYVVNLDKLLSIYDPHGVESRPGELVETKGDATETKPCNCTVSECKNCTQSKGRFDQRSTKKVEAVVSDSCLEDQSASWDYPDGYQPADMSEERASARIDVSGEAPQPASGSGSPSAYGDLVMVVDLAEMEAEVWGYRVAGGRDA